MEKKTAKELGLKSDEACDRKAPKKLQDKLTMEMWNAKGFGGDRKAPKIVALRIHYGKVYCEGDWLKTRRSPARNTDISLIFIDLLKL